MLIWKLFLAIPLSPGSDPLQPTKIKGEKQSCSNTWIQGRNHEVNAPFASVFDRMALIQKFKCVRMTFSKFADKLLKLAINKSKAEHVNVVLIVYCHDPIKNAKRGYCLVETLQFKEIIFPTPIKSTFLSDGPNNQSWFVCQYAVGKNSSVIGNKKFYVAFDEDCFSIFLSVFL